MRMNFGRLVVAFLCWGVALPAVGDEMSDCEDYKSVHIEGKNGLASEADYLKSRNQLLNQLLVDAVAQVNGAEFRTRETTQLNVANGKVDDRYNQVNVRRAKGQVRSYAFAPDGETIEDSDIGKLLKLVLDVIVCVQPGGDDSVYVTVGDIEFPGYEEFANQELTEFVRAAIPEDSKLRMVKNEGDVTYYDYVISGKIMNIAATFEDSALKAMIGNVVRTGNNKPIVESRYTRMSATIALKAQNAVDLSYTVVTETVERKVSVGMSEGALTQRINEFAGDAVRDVSAKLFRKVLNHEGFKQPTTRK